MLLEMPSLKLPIFPQSGSMLLKVAQCCAHCAVWLNVAQNCLPLNPPILRQSGSFLPPFAQCGSMWLNVAHLSHQGRLALGPDPDSTTPEKTCEMCHSERRPSAGRPAAVVEESFLSQGRQRCLGSLGMTG